MILKHHMKCHHREYIVKWVISKWSSISNCKQNCKNINLHSQPQMEISHVVNNVGQPGSVKKICCTNAKTTINRYGISVIMLGWVKRPCYHYNVNSQSVNSLAPGRDPKILMKIIFKFYANMHLYNFPHETSLGRNPRLLIQLWCRSWLGPVWQRATAWTNVDLV